MQLPSPWLSEITKPFSWAVLFKFSDSSVWLVSLRASNWLCWSVWNVKSPVNSRGTKLFAVKRCGAYKYQRVPFRFQATLSPLWSNNNIMKDHFLSVTLVQSKNGCLFMLICSEVYSIVTYFRKTDLATTGACIVVTKIRVKMNSLFYKNRQ